MDLLELEIHENEGAQRHPWELARVDALATRLRQQGLHRHLDVLDVGSGDGYTGISLLRRCGWRKLTGLDTHLSDQQIAQLQARYPEATYTNDPTKLRTQHYELLLLLDVLEHVPHDRDFLGQLVGEYVAPGGHVLITVPAFQLLFSAHDEFLKHYRRYNLSQLRDLIEGVGLRPCRSGYLFSSLLLPRALAVAAEKLRPNHDPQTQGLGAWKHGNTLTQLIRRTLQIDNSLLLTCDRLGLQLPGLSTWALCQKP